MRLDNRATYLCQHVLSGALVAKGIMDECVGRRKDQYPTATSGLGLFLL